MNSTMKLVHPDFLCPIHFVENKVETLVIESPEIFSKILLELKDQVEGEEGKWVLSKNGGELLRIPKVCTLIIDPLSVDLNQRKTVNALYDRIQQEVTTTELLVQWNQIYPTLVQMAEKMKNCVEYRLKYRDDIEVKEYLKFMEVKFSDDSENFVEKIINYICLSKEVLGTELFLFVNIKSYLTDRNLNFLMEQAFYKKINLLLIESQVSAVNLEGERVTVIDKDSCIIVSDMS